MLNYHLPNSTPSAKRSRGTDGSGGHPANLVLLPVAIIGLAPLLPVIVLMHLVRLVDDNDQETRSACHECPGPEGCPHFQCCREHAA